MVLYGQDSLQTVPLGPLKIEVDVVERGYVVSTKNWLSLGAYIHIIEEENSMYLKYTDECKRQRMVSDSVIVELEFQVNMFKDRSVLYKDAYRENLESIYELNNLMNQQREIIISEGRRSTWRGAAIGGAAGIVVGLVTAFILLN